MWKFEKFHLALVLIALCLIFQEEEDLVNAHRKQVEETMDIVKEVCDEHKFGVLLHVLKGCFLVIAIALGLHYGS